MSEPAQTTETDAYHERNQLVALLARMYPSGIKRTEIDGWDREWHGCVYIDLPTGQASWHYHDRESCLFADLPGYAGEWDGHTTDEKYHRIAKLRGYAHGECDIREALLAVKKFAQWPATAVEEQRGVALIDKALSLIGMINRAKHDGESDVS